MPRVYITCPRTGQPVRTGVSMTTASFHAGDVGAHSTTCPACGSLHRWSKDEAFFEEALFALDGIDVEGAGDDLFGDNPWRL